jgi:hypothetical protein
MDYRSCEAFLSVFYGVTTVVAPFCCSAVVLLRMLGFIVQTNQQNAKTSGCNSESTIAIQSGSYTDSLYCATVCTKASGACMLPPVKYCFALLVL